MSIQIKISKEELSTRKLFVATPMYGGQCFGTYTRAIADLAVMMNAWGVKLQMYFLFNESLITRARNYVADEFLRSDCTHLMFIDSDIGFDPKDVMAMLALMSDESDYDVMAGPYPKKTIAWEKIKRAVDKGLADDNPAELEKYVGDYVFNPIAGGGSIPIDRPSEVAEAGTGFMMIRRTAFDAVKKNRPDLAFRPDHVRTANFDGSREVHGYFMDPIDQWSREKVFGEALRKIVTDEEGDYDFIKAMAKAALDHDEPETRRLLSEDYFFCHEVRKAGGKVWLCPWIKLTHTGTYTFGGSLADLSRLGVTATADAEEVSKMKRKR